MAEELTCDQALVIEARKQTAHLERISQIVTFLFVLGMVAAAVWLFSWFISL